MLIIHRYAFDCLQRCHSDTCPHYRTCPRCRHVSFGDLAMRRSSARLLGLGSSYFYDIKLLSSWLNTCSILQGLAGWTVDALPVADCGGADGMWSPVDAASLCGFDIISVYDSQSGNGGDDKKYSCSFFPKSAVHPAIFANQGQGLYVGAAEHNGRCILPAAESSRLRVRG